jgi:hypothetical protein
MVKKPKDRGEQQPVLQKPPEFVGPRLAEGTDRVREELDASLDNTPASREQALMAELQRRREAGEIHPDPLPFAYIQKVMDRRSAAAPFPLMAKSKLSCSRRMKLLHLGDSNSSVQMASALKWKRVN